MGFYVDNATNRRLKRVDKGYGPDVGKIRPKVKVEKPRAKPTAKPRIKVEKPTKPKPTTKPKIKPKKERGKLTAKEKKVIREVLSQIDPMAPQRELVERVNKITGTKTHRKIDFRDYVGEVLAKLYPSPEIAVKKKVKKPVKRIPTPVSTKKVPKPVKKVKPTVSPAEWKYPSGAKVTVKVGEKGTYKKPGSRGEPDIIRYFKVIEVKPEKYIDIRFQGGKWEHKRFTFRKSGRWIEEGLSDTDDANIHLGIIIKRPPRAKVKVVPFEEKVLLEAEPKAVAKAKVRKPQPMAVRARKAMAEFL